ncbi:hypothetical protein ACHAAC_07465 [Aeromicrobium sp. CF4.19]|uniref:hypothetical protein n=1 Tax=Aeromicrobium sp. CF4.19 TaxID=3373082 RepID=UPI003EE6B8FF
MSDPEHVAFGGRRWFSSTLALVLIAFWVGVIVVEGFSWASAAGIAGMAILLGSHLWDWRREVRRRAAGRSAEVPRRR